MNAIHKWVPARELEDLDALLSSVRGELIRALAVGSQDPGASRRMVIEALRRTEQVFASWAADVLRDDRRGVTGEQAHNLKNLVEGETDSFFRSKSDPAGKHP